MRKCSKFLEYNGSFMKEMTGRGLANSCSKIEGIANSIPNDRKIWIDLDNSPHVPLFSPILAELNNIGFKTILTARDCAQTCELAELHNLQYMKVGRHYGKQKILKVAGTIYRACLFTLILRFLVKANLILHSKFKPQNNRRLRT